MSAPTDQTPRVVFPEWDNPRIVAARAELAAGGQALPIPVAPPDETLITTLIGLRPMKRAMAQRMVSRPLIRAALMVSAGMAEAMVAGVETPTRRVIEAAALGIGLAEPDGIASSFFLMQMPDGRRLILADCAVNVSPSAEELAAIARASAVSGRKLLGEARVALLSYSTGTSGTGPQVDLVRAAAELSGHVGPVQADAALNAQIARDKGMGTGDANVLVFPSLESGNIAYKLLQELAGAQAIGPILQGFRHPVCDLSRGARVDDIVAATLVTLSLR